MHISCVDHIYKWLTNNISNGVPQRIIAKFQLCLIREYRDFSELCTMINSFLFKQQGNVCILKNMYNEFPKVVSCLQ